MRLSVLSTATVLLSSLAAAQNVDETVNFKTFGGFDDLKKCLRAVFTVDFQVNLGNTVQSVIGCSTNKCLCRPDTLDAAVLSAGSMALSQCSNSNDKTSATSILSEYCSEHYTAVPNATPADSTDPASSEVTPVVQTQTVSIITSVNNIPTTIFSTVATTATPAVTSPPASKDSNIGSAEASKPNLAGPIAGGVVGGLFAIAIIIGLILLFLRKKKANHQYISTEQGVSPSHQYPDSKTIGGIQDYSRA